MKYLVAWLTWKFALGIMVGVLVMGILIAYLTGLVPTSKPDCPYTGDSDSSTIANIIQAEADAASNEDISIILKIFDPNATIRFAGDGTEWHDPVAYYRDIFKDIEVNDAVHFAIQPTGKGISNDTAWFISGSSGFWAPNGEELSYYYNEPGKDTWVLKKNRSGCWVIVEYGYH